MRNAVETNLAWTFIEAVKPHLSEPERYRVFITIGAGDTFAAIRLLLKLAAANNIPLRADLVRRCVIWLDTYAHHDEQQHLRPIIEGYLTPGPAPTSATGLGGDILAGSKHIESAELRRLIRCAMAAC
ncbi:hypothetical protein ACRU43_15320 [Mycobacterium colombiense]|uniref:hypothetical protein n=1 Tax=Mycobacterium colombiense TaxID=339268 RepID=UPI0011E4D506|nr:hypothetical protein [Mycobacterium colombiense]